MCASKICYLLQIMNIHNILGLAFINPTMIENTFDDKVRFMFLIDFVELCETAFSPISQQKNSA